MKRPQIESIMDDRLLVQELNRRLETGEGVNKAAEWNIPAEELRRTLVEAPAPSVFDTMPLSEAIVVEFGRPSLLVKNSTFSLPESDVWKNRLYPTKSKLEHAIQAVGRLELLDHDTYPWAGTAWMITEDIAVTNRHVALIFAQKRGKGFAFIRNALGKTVRAQVDFREEYKQQQSLERGIKNIIFIEELSDTHPDLAFVRLDKSIGLPDPIVLSTAPLKSTLQPDHYVGVIGYPARDSRNDATAMLNVFGDIYDVKRFAPGRITSIPDGASVFTHDCSTLGGNSGSAVIDINTGEAIGLHFGGQPRLANYAVKAETLLQALRHLKIQVPGMGVGGRANGKIHGNGKPAAADEPKHAEAGAEAEAPRPQDYANKQGYSASFLGATKKNEVPLPVLSAEQLANTAKLTAPGDTRPDYLLNYTHFSLAMNAKRRMAYYTASNIDGNQQRRIPRSRDVWYMDPRIAKTAQVGEEVYRNNDLDRGHLTRRLDPVWGSEAEAKEANGDTFHFTNACPQHKDFNQKTWNDLEDYVLDNAGAHNLKIMVFTGPVFQDADPPYRGIKLPQEFWKVVVMVRASDMKLSATAYMLSQKNLISDLREFVFGQFKTYQLPIRQLETLTGLNFGKLHTYDPLDRQEAFPIRLVSAGNDMLF
ncbi:MAG: DNA/RNA non-specific endonuclease [Chloroflexota bacterium]